MLPPWPFLDLHIRLSLLSGCRNFCWDFRQFGLLRSAASTFDTLNSIPLVFLDGSKDITFPTRTAMDTPKWPLVDMSTAMHLSSYEKETAFDTGIAHS